jgi:NAD(P)-dependent dehydrogenase (short-subunit alcohol dehydrogenase family)
MNKWSYSNIPVQNGRVAIVTGANSGLGFYTTKGLAEKGCEVIMACRSMEKGEEARSIIIKDYPDALLHVMKLDLANMKSVHSFAIEFAKSFKHLDLLINNAGLMAIPYRKTVDGFEMQFGVNHLGHFALTGLLFNLLKKTPGSRVVNVSSAAHNLGEIRFEDINWQNGYNKWKAYGMSKLANIHFTFELADRVTAKGLDMLVTVAHPGYADSKLIEKGPEMNGRNFLVKAGRFANRIVAQSTEMGALPTLYAATSPEAVHRAFYGPDGFGGMRGYPVRTYPNKKKINKEVHQKLWKLSEKMTGVSFL